MRKSYHFATPAQLEKHLCQILASLRHQTATQTAFSGSLDGSIKLWDLQAHKCWQTLITPRPYEDMKIAGIQGLTKAQSATLKVLGAAPIIS